MLPLKTIEAQYMYSNLYIFRDDLSRIDRVQGHGPLGDGQGHGHRRLSPGQMVGNLVNMVLHTARENIKNWSQT